MITNALTGFMQPPDKLEFVELAMRACLSLWERCPQGGEGPLSHG